MKSLASFSNKPMTRTALFAAALMAGMSALPVHAQQATVFRAIRVDMSAIPAGARQTRDDLQVCLSMGLPRAFAGRINPAAQGAPLLVVRPTSVWLAAIIAGPMADDMGGGDFVSSYDSMEGEAIIGNRRVPLTVTASPPVGPAGLPFEMARVRASTLCNSFVAWLARKI